MIIFADSSKIYDLIPNRLKEAPGEVALHLKLTTYLEQAEQRLTNEIFSQSVVDQIKLPDFAQLLFHAQRAVAYAALALAIPALDLVFTPNGLAVVQSQTLAPASRDRTKRLVDNCINMRDRNICAALRLLANIPDWRSSLQGKFFAGSFIQVPDQVEHLRKKEESLYDAFIRTRIKAVEIETTLADKFFSSQLLDALRAEKLAGSLTLYRESLAERISAQVFASLDGARVDEFKMVNAVDFIRKNQQQFPEWFSSEIAELFSPPVFQNKKSASGYFL